MVYFNTHKTYYDIPIHFDKPPVAIKAYQIGNAIRVEAENHPPKADLTKNSPVIAYNKPTLR